MIEEGKIQTLSKMFSMRKGNRHTIFYEANDLLVFMLRIIKLKNKQKDKQVL